METLIISEFEIAANKLLDLMLHIRRKIELYKRNYKLFNDKEFGELGKKWGEEVKCFEEKTGLKVNVDMFRDRIKNNSIV